MALVAIASVAATSMVWPAGGPAGAQAEPSRAERYVDALAADLLGREPTAGERSRWVAEVDAGRRGAVAAEVAHHPDHARAVVAALYDRALGRSPEPAGLAFWTGQLAAGRPVAHLAADVYGSDEAYRRAGGQAGAYVEATYRALLGRASDAPGRAYWVARIGAGEPLPSLGKALYLTMESNALRTTLVYLDLLRRPAFAGERSYWAERLRRTDDLDAIALVASSGEYESYVQEPRRLSVTALSGRGFATGSDPTISGDGRWVAFLSRLDGLAPGTADDTPDVLLLDRRTGRWRRLGAGNGRTGRPELSADGSTVVFSSAASNLVAGDGNGVADVFLARTAGGPILRLTDGDGPSEAPSTDADGSRVAFTSSAADPLGGTPGTAPADVHVADVDQSGAVTALQGVGGDGPSTAPAISADGTALVFLSEAEDLGPTTAAGADAFWARLPLAGTTYLALSDAGPGLPGPAPSVSDDGSVVTFLEVAAVGQWSANRAHLARIEDGAVVDEQTLGNETHTRTRISDDGQATLVDVYEPYGTTVLRYGHHRTAPSATPTGVGIAGDMSADGALVVSAVLQLTVASPSYVALHDLR